MSLQNAIPLPRVSPELLDRYGKSPGYMKLGSMVRDGRLRTQVVNGRHYVLESDLPALAAELGLIPVHAV